MTPPTEYQRNHIARLVSRLEGVLPLSLREEFISCMQQELHSFSVQALIRGQIPIGSMFACIRRALKKTQEVAVSRADALPWESLFFDVLESYEHIVAQPHGEAPKNKAKPASHQADPSQQQDCYIKPVKVGSSSAAKKDLKQRPLPNAAAAAQQPSVEEVLATLDITSTPTELYRRPGQKYIKCKVEDCTFCPAMYESMAITPCSRFGHADCNHIGWFPHVGISLWKTLRNQHDAGLPFKPRSVEIKDGDLPPLIQLRTTKGAAKRPGSPMDTQTSKVYLGSQ